MKRIDLNADLGESQAALQDGTQSAILGAITSANIACGGHAGDPGMMRTTLEQCRRHGVAAGAHPSYPDRENFGRATLDMSLADLTASIAEQLRSLRHLARQLGVAITHIKPHGALYNDAAKNPQLAQAIVRAVGDDADVVLYGLRGSIMIDVFREAGFRTAAEVFADRAYQPDASLRPRHLPGALITDPAEAAANALKLAESKADTICVHSDTPNAIAIARAVRATLISSSFTIGPI